MIANQKVVNSTIYQLIAANVDLAQSIEKITNLNNNLIKLKILSRFLDETNPYRNIQLDGFSY